MPGENGGENFYVYKLVPPNTCYSSYCGGTEVPPCQADFVLQDGECVGKLLATSFYNYYI